MIIYRIYRDILFFCIMIFDYIGYLSIKNKTIFYRFNNGYNIRTINEESDFREALRIHNLSDDLPPPEKRMYTLFKLFGKKTFFIAEKDGELSGYCFFKVTVTINRKGLSKKAFLLLLGVHPNHRNKGIATALLQNSIKILKKNMVAKLYLNVDRNNNPAIYLYNNMGFKITNKPIGDECYRLEMII